ncbi:arsenite efflux transporter metallochaperone ArsD [Candidatus Desantisbacteria bacterium]|nr:arsenite efflux transporter metallochaperone ArsD [Candidatus Desantisbacteria bacterium]
MTKRTDLKINAIIKVYDPPMCCSTGVCGTKIDEKLIEFANALKILSKSGATVERFNMAQTPNAFIENIKVKKIIAQKGQKSLPLIFINDELKWSGKIPSTEEILKTFGIDYKPQTVNKCGCCGASKCNS